MHFTLQKDKYFCGLNFFFPKKNYKQKSEFAILYQLFRFVREKKRNCIKSPRFHAPNWLCQMLSHRARIIYPSFQAFRIY